MKEHIIKNITVKADELSRQYNKTKDPLIWEKWYQVVRSLDNFQPYDNETLDIILKPPLQVVQKARRHTR
jgi:hypothetical protein